LQALRIKPDFPEAINNLGVYLLRKGKIERAIVFFKEALRIKPDFTDAQKNLDVALSAQSKNDTPIQKVKR